jgi:hypothetical protein
MWSGIPPVLLYGGLETVAPKTKQTVQEVSNRLSTTGGREDGPQSGH